MHYMKMPAPAPAVIYDNRCSVCSVFARCVSMFGRGRISLIGHYTDGGVIMRSLLGEQATEMFWHVDEETACGGRSALLPLLRSILRAWFGKIPPSEFGSIKKSECGDSCGKNAVFFRSASLLKRSQKIRF